MAIQQNDTGKSSTFGRGLMSYITQRLPYTYQEVNNIEEKNPKYKEWEKYVNDIPKYKWTKISKNK